jgi:hypothetical protein
VQVRCSCRGHKVKWACHDVRQELRRRGLRSDLEGSMAVQLLDCNAKCEELRVGPTAHCGAGLLGCHVSCLVLRDD